MKKITTTIIALFFLFAAKSAFSHCEVPCGIYDDELRVKLVKEHIVTIEKSMKQIEELSEAAKPNYNQIVRWTVTKEDHANKIQEIVTQYFMTQRVKLAENEEQIKKNAEQLAALHEILVYAMKSKQTTDLQYIGKMRAAVERFEIAYFGKILRDHEHKH